MSNASKTTNEITSDGIAIPRSVRFWFFLLFEIPSIFCSIFVLAYLLFDRTLRHALHNHIIIIILFINLIVQLTNISSILNYYRLGSVWPPTPTFCLSWVFIDETLYIATTILFSWGTIERHILIFHDHWLSTRTKLIFIHYVPIGFLSLYCLLYNIVVIIFPPCENTFDYTQVVCGYPLCSYEDASLALWDVVVNDIIPTIVIIFCSTALLGRILYQKSRMHRPIRWRQHRKMAIQLLSISTLYLILYIPKILLEFAYLCGVSEDIGADFILYAKFFSYYANLLFPFICAGSLPNLRMKIKNIIPYWRRQARAVAPQVFPLGQKTGGRFIQGPINVH
jgi:hypothetical protein